jgi:hypothetical protein
MAFYTAAAYDLFQKEISKSTDYLARQKPGANEYEVVHVKPHKKLPWGRDKFTVRATDGQGFKCECGLHEHFGMLCSHVLRVSYANVARLTVKNYGYGFFFNFDKTLPIYF